ncbi:uncharacterized protein LOC125664326 [Ostrea edulis]|uniref:uncharacterized protein LOC125664326 n=1 Tax=Ostrea edulis TaxID=37623 RepID=UPI00209475BC|nr:uncharacterized protein LOC125664326 [Ostrea edulis]XP_048753008.1 uncharacterized protein LOC125664326 [Ostrea edulis]
MEKKRELQDFKIIPATEAVYMIIRFRDDLVTKIRNALTLSKRGVENYHGKIIGISGEVHVYEEDLTKWPSNRRILVIYFKNRDNAVRWLNSDRYFKNDDFPSPSDTLQMFLIPVHYTADKENYTFHLQEFGNWRDWDKLNSGYVQHAAKCMDTFKVQHGAAFTNESEGLRCSFVRKGNLVVLHRFQSQDHFENFYYSKAYETLKQFRRTQCECNSTVFTINPDLRNP